MPNAPDPRGSYREMIRQSPPVDLTRKYSPEWMAGKTILITGGASGFGEAFFRRFASHGANVIIGDISTARGHALVAEVRKATNNDNHHYLDCNVTNWQSQVDFFKQAVRLSPTGGIDTVIANAGIVDKIPTFESPVDLDADTPPKPNFLAFEVDLVGVMYTAHLAFFWLQKNPRSVAASYDRTPAANTPDRHLVLLGSVASIMPLPGQVLYNISKHGVMGLFRACRGTSFMNGIRINMLCPYFIDTPILPVAARMLLAGGATGKPEDVVEAATRLVADTRIIGRALVIGPKLKVKGGTAIQKGDSSAPDQKGKGGEEGDWELVPMSDANGKEMSIWECYADDWEKTDAFVGRFLGLLNAVEVARGWAGWGVDVLKAFTYPLGIAKWFG